MSIPDMGQPQSFLGIAAEYIGSVNGYARFRRLSTIEQYIGVNESDIEGTGQLVEGIDFQEVRVPNGSRLALSAYPELPPSLVPPNLGSIGPEPIKPKPVPTHAPPLKKGFFLTDGSPLTPILKSGQIVGFSGTSAAGHKYALETSVDVTPASVTKNPDVLAAQLTLTKDNGDHFGFGVSYCGERLIGAVGAYLADAAKWTTIVEDGILINAQNANADGWYPGLQEPASPTATLNRSLTYYGDTFSQQSVTVAGSTMDAQVHLSLDAVFWPYLPDIALFEDAFALLASESSQLLTLNGQPLMDLGGIPSKMPPASAAELEQYFTQSIIPALAYVSSRCVAAVSPGNGILGNAAKWLCGLLLTGDGLQGTLKAAQILGQYLADHHGYWGGGGTDWKDFMRVFESLNTRQK